MYPDEHLTHSSEAKQMKILIFVLWAVVCVRGPEFLEIANHPAILLIQTLWATVCIGFLQLTE
jgi:hypothetical protein